MLDIQELPRYTFIVSRFKKNFLIFLSDYIEGDFVTIGTSVIIISKNGGLANTLESYLDDQHVSCGVIPVEELFRLSFLEDEVVQLSVKLIISDVECYSNHSSEFQQFIEKHPVHPPLILIAEPDEVELAVQATHDQAFHYLVNPVKKLDFNLAVDRALHFREILGQNLVLRRELKNSRSVGHIIGKSPAMQEVFDLIHRVAHTSANVLIQGESGTGKELVARAIHDLGSRSKKPFVAINCTAIPEGLLESELFGHAKGSFTGAVSRKKGLFEEADGGTLFLDEIGDMNMSLQAKLLRVIQDRRVRAVGDNLEKNIDVRIITATHKDLRAGIREGRFREDLYYRLCVIPMVVPALRYRGDDVILLAEYFLEKYNAANGTRIKGFTRTALDILLKMKWEGNVRELENVVERAVVLCRGQFISPEDLPGADDFGQEGFFAHLTDQLPPLEEVEKRYIMFVLDKVGGKKEKAAQILGLNRRTLYRKEREYGWSVESEHEDSEHAEKDSEIL
jgi:DNA-binding NtrC family response regulator